MGDSIWERGFSWPKSGPMRWIGIYFAAVSCVGFLVWAALSFVSPTEPDQASGYIYWVLRFGRGTPDFYVRAFDACALRIWVAHVAVLVLVGGGVSLLNLGARGRASVD